MTIFVVMSLTLLLIGVTITTISVIIKMVENYRNRKIRDEMFKEFEKEIK